MKWERRENDQGYRSTRPNNGDQIGNKHITASD